MTSAIFCLFHLSSAILVAQTLALGFLKKTQHTSISISIYPEYPVFVKTLQKTFEKATELLALSFSNINFEVSSSIVELAS
jgi:hypothetical protein